MSEKTKEEILAEQYGIKLEYLNVHLGKIITERNLSAMQDFANQQTTHLSAEAARYKKALEERITAYQKRIEFLKTLGKDRRWDIEITTLKTVIKDLDALNEKA